MDSVGGSTSRASASRAIDKLLSLLTKESKLLQGVEPSEIDDLRDELASIKSYLQDSDFVFERDERVKNRLKEIEEVVELIDAGVADEYILEVSQRSRRHGFIKFLAGKAGRLVGTLNSRPNLALNIHYIKEWLREIRERGRGYHSEFSSTRTIVERYHPQFVSPVPEECIVGFDSPGDELIQRLTEGATRRSVISIVGVGGIGKTTLARRVYDNQVVRKHFDFHAWITVSQSYSALELLKIMANEIIPGEKHDIEEIDKTRFTELITTLRQSLQSKRYMLVFDDVWQVEFWLVMRHALPDDDNGSRIIVTTRSDAVVTFCNESSFDHIHKLEPWSEAKSWDLFRRMLFQDNPEFRCPPQLEPFSFEFIRTCEGLPLAIVAIAGLLSTKEKSVSEWKRVLESIHSQHQFYPEIANVYKILDLSFRDLPSQLQLCFLYFRIFPEGSLIPNEKLVKSWIAEGFVIEQKGLTLEKIAEGYLNELIERNMVQACQGFYELEKFCRVHDLMHEIAREKAYEFNFCQVWDKNTPSFGRNILRLSICNNIETVLESIQDSHVHSVFLFDISVLEVSFMITLFKRYKYLTLLDFENVPLELLPYELGNLFNLKYLNLKNTKLRRLPRSIGKLYNLQTLDLRNTLLIELPTEINNLQNLRHLLACGNGNKISKNSTQGVRINKGFGRLENLQTLVTLDAHLSGIGFVRELETLWRLRRLDISRLTAEVCSALCAYISQMSHLESLSLYSVNGNEILDLQAISSPPLFLQHLVLKGLLQKFPDWFSSLQNLSMLCLKLSRLRNDPLELLCCLPNLASLWLYQAYDGEQLHFQEGGFPKLKLLVLRELQGLNVVEIQEGSLTRLEELRIGSSPLMKEVPSGIQHLINLQVLANYDMPREFVLSMQPDGGSEYSKVEHVPSVLFWYRVEERRYISYKLGDPELLSHLQDLGSNIKDLSQRHVRLSLYYSDNEEETISTWSDVNQLSFSSGRISFFSDDIED